MTREESLEVLCVAFEKLDEDEQREMIRLIEQMKRAHTFGLDVRLTSTLSLSLSQMQRPTPLLPRRR